MELLIGLLMAAIIGIGNLLEDYQTKDMTSDQKIEREWKKLERKYHF